LLLSAGFGSLASASFASTFGWSVCALAGRTAPSHRTLAPASAAARRHLNFKDIPFPLGTAPADPPRPASGLYGGQAQFPRRERSRNRNIFESGAYALSARLLDRLGGRTDGFDDFRVRGATAEIAGEIVPDLVFARVRFLLEQLMGHEHKARRA